MQGATFVTDLAMVLGVGALTSVLARLVRQPTIVGYLLAGLIVGPYIPIPLFADPHRVEALAEFGVILVMFSIGLELRVAKLAAVLPVSGLTVLIQIGLLIWSGSSLGEWLGWTTVESLFLGTSIAISSTMVVAKVFEQRTVAPDLRQYVLGILVLQDVAAIALIAAMTALAAGGGLGPRELASMLGRLGGVLAGLLVGGMLVVPRVVRAVARLQSAELLGLFSIGVCFTVAVLAAELGYSVALGAFLAGVLVAESGRGAEIEHLIRPVRDMFAAVFFVSIGMTVQPSQALASLPVALGVFGVVVTAQLLTVSVAGVLSGNGLRRSISAGLSLGQIGEFAFIIGGIGIAAGVVRPALQAVLVTVAVLSAFSTPILLGRADAIVRFVDGRMPRRLHHLLGLYEGWFARLAAAGDGKTASPARQAVRAMALDVAALIVLMSLAVAWLPAGLAWLSDRLGMSAGQARLVTAGAVLVAALPLLVGMLRSGTSLSRLVAGTILSAPSPSRAARIAARTFRTMVLLLALAAVGVPTVAVLEPLIGGVAGAALLAGGAAIGSFVLWRSAGAVEDEVRSGAERLGQALGMQSGTDEGPSSPDPSVIPGLDAVVGCPITESSHAVGRTLAELNLRALTGATVVAISRAGPNVVLPTGRERLEPGDVLAVIGTSAAVSEARDLLQRGGPPRQGRAGLSKHE